MKRKRVSVEQIVAVLKQAEAGTPVAELINHVGVWGTTGNNGSRGDALRRHGEDGE